ncbi:MAG: hypothetical protein SNJ78_00880 [Spirochaetales bacterium]
MKFKTIFIFFNSILIFSLIFIFFMPFFIIGRGYALDFWKQNWYISLLFLLVLFIMNTYFLKNWKLFLLMEGENWQGIKAFLEAKIKEGKKLSEQNARILMNTYLVLGESDKMLSLSNTLKTQSPRVYKSLAVELGVGHLMKSNPEGLEEYYTPLTNTTEVKGVDYARFSLALAYLFAHRYEDALKALTEFQNYQKEPILFLLSNYLLHTLKGEDPQILEEIESRRKWFLTTYPSKKWERYIEGRKENLVILVLSRFIQDASFWIYGKSEVSNGSTKV